MKHVKLRSELLTKDDIPTPMDWDEYVTDSSDLMIEKTWLEQ